MPDSDFHGWNGQTAVKTRLSDGRLSKTDASLIEAFIAERKSTRNLSAKRVNSMTFALLTFRELLDVEYRNTSPALIYAAISNLQRSRKRNTVTSYTIVWKMFMLWLIENGECLNVPVSKVTAIRSGSPDTNTTAPDEILTPEEIKRLIDAARSSRDRAIVSTLYESGCRAGELTELKWKDLEFSKHGVRISVTDQKESQRRTAYLLISREYLAALKNDSQHNAAGDYVFVTVKGDRILYKTLVRIISKIAKRAGITKRANLHLFRKSRITHLIQQGYQESIIKRSMWNNLNTQMFKTYVCLSDTDIENEFLDKAGIKKKADQPNPLKPIPCPRCGTVMPAGSLYCSKCAMGLTAEAEQDIEEKLLNVLHDPEKRKILFGE